MVLPCPWPNVRALIERETDGVLHLVIQRRNKPNEDALYELPGGSLEKFEPLIDCLRREVMEETGMRVTEILDAPSHIVVTNRGGLTAESARPFAAYQTVRGSFPGMGVYFRCHATGHPLAEGDGTVSARWISIDDLARLVTNDPDGFMTFDLAGITQWLAFHGVAVGVSDGYRGTQHQTSDRDCPDIEIVPITEEHIEGFHRCLDAVARERKYLSFVEAPSMASTAAFVRSNIASGAVQLVAVAREDVVGWCDILTRKMPGYTHSGTLGLGVEASFRGRGLGKRLASAALRQALDKGITRVELEVYASNTVAIALYHGMGFATEGVKKRARYLDGCYEDIVSMALHMGQGVAP